MEECFVLIFSEEKNIVCAGLALGSLGTIGFNIQDR